MLRWFCTRTFPKAEERATTAQKALQLARERYRLGLGPIVEITQSEVALTGVQT